MDKSKSQRPRSTDSWNSFLGRLSRVGSSDDRKDRRDDSRERSKNERSREKDRGKSEDRDRDRDRNRGSRERDGKDRSRDRDRSRDKDGDRSRDKDRDRDRDRSRDRDRDRDRSKERERKERNRDRSNERERFEREKQKYDDFVSASNVKATETWDKLYYKSDQPNQLTPNDKVLVIKNLNSLGNSTQILICPYCHNTVATDVDHKVGGITYACCCGVIATGICNPLIWFFCLCWVPFCCSRTKDAKHTCSSCHKELGIYKPI